MLLKMPPMTHYFVKRIKKILIGCLCLCMCVSSLCICLWEHACGGKRATSDIVSQNCLLLFRFILILVYVCVCVCGRGLSWASRCLWRSLCQRRSLGFFQLKLQVVGSCLMWVLGTKFVVSARAAFTQSLNCLSCLWPFEPVAPVGCAGWVVSPGTSQSPYQC